MMPEGFKGPRQSDSNPLKPTRAERLRGSPGPGLLGTLLKDFSSSPPANSMCVGSPRPSTLHELKGKACSPSFSNQVRCTVAGHPEQVQAIPMNERLSQRQEAHGGARQSTPLSLPTRQTHCQTLPEKEDQVGIQAAACASHSTAMGFVGQWAGESEPAMKRVNTHSLSLSPHLEITETQ